MSARERYSFEIECPKCSHKGTVHVSEDDHPYMTKLHRKIDEVKGEFLVQMDKAGYAITCTKCQTAFDD